MKDKKKILHVITGLGDGGAEGVLSRLCINEKSNDHIVVSLLDGGKYGGLLKDSGVPVFCLHMNSDWLGLISAPYKLYQILKIQRPDVVQTWMYHADLLGGIVAKLAGVKKVYWGIRHSTLKVGESKLTTILIARLCALLSYILPVKIICCAESARAIHAAIGYKKTKLVVIQNGYEFDKLREDKGLGSNFRSEIGVSEETVLLGMVGRYNSQKGHDVFIKALGLIKNQIDFVCCFVGREMDFNNKDLLAALEREDIQERVMMLGPRNDIVAVMNALDLHVLPSTYGEGFPNVVAESIACGTPCLASNVGDAANIIQNALFVVPPGDDVALAERLIKIISLKKNEPELWESISCEMQNGVYERYSIGSMLEKYNAAWALNDV
ncbi:MAG: glycosyl transferase family 1 [Thalassobium sp.]|nr:MAG: glycosyl transferase family 1 [Thalassobium sp.]